MARKSRFIVVLGCLMAMAVVTVADAESNIRKRNVGGRAAKSERAEQADLFNYYLRHLNLTYETKFDKLKKSASVPKWRIPYSTSIHPESQGGLADVNVSQRGGLFARPGRVSVSGGGVLGKYDMAFNNGRQAAAGWETGRLVRHQPVGLFRRRTQQYIDSEEWEGYCSGFTASTIRHPEPVRAVDAGKVGGRAGVVFQPAEIKALLLAAYNRTVNDSYLYLAPPSARDGGPNMGTFHLALTNYIGQGGYPIGIDRTKGRISWNNPIYTYQVQSVKDLGTRNDIRFKEVVNKITYTFYGTDDVIQTDLKTGDRRIQKKQSLTLRYVLELDKEGHIIGGQSRSHSGHFLWVPLYAVQGIRSQKSPGNPYLRVKDVLALARASALPEIQAKYDKSVFGPKIDPAIEARALAKAEKERKERERRQREAQVRAEAQRQRAAANSTSEDE